MSQIRSPNRVRHCDSNYLTLRESWLRQRNRKFPRTSDRLPFWRPATNVDPLFSIEQAQDFSQEPPNKLTMAEDNQPTKRHKTSNTHTEHNTTQASPIGDELDSQILIAIGEEENKQETDGNMRCATCKMDQGTISIWSRLNKKRKRWHPGTISIWSPHSVNDSWHEQSKPLATSPVWCMVVFLCSRLHQI
jgi:hypothetical protein